MLLTNQSSIRDVLLFPQMKPQKWWKNILKIFLFSH
jgi:hypothetical protein